MQCQANHEPYETATRLMEEAIKLMSEAAKTLAEPPHHQEPQTPREVPGQLVVLEGMR